jgi:hypothetical protein
MSTATSDKLINNISDIKYCLYINLEARKDRKEHIESQFKSVGIVSPRRFNAIKLKNGRVGCSMSHLKCIEIAKKLWRSGSLISRSIPSRILPIRIL